MEQKQVLENLYALRAGLSVISQQYDKAQAIENECDDKLEKNAGKLSETQYRDTLQRDGIYSQLDKLKVTYGYESDLSEKFANRTYEGDESIQQYEDWQSRLRENETKCKKAFNHWLAYNESTAFFQKALTDSQKNKDSVKRGQDSSSITFSYKKAYKRKRILSIIFFVIAALLSVVMMGMLLSDFFGDWNEGTADIITFILILAIPLLVFFILGIVYIFKSKSDKAKHIEALNSAISEVAKIQQMLNLLPLVRENARNILKEKDGKILPIKESCNEYYMALKKQFSFLLDERDWENLDLVIYELETRRADSVKEALQLVDRELQTKRIQQSIAQATEQICYEIRRGFAEMKATIIECSRVISAQLVGMSMQLEGIRGQLGELCDSVNMSNALQAKANVTSAQLVSDVHAIRYYGI